MESTAQVGPGRGHKSRAGIGLALRPSTPMSRRGLIAPLWRSVVGLFLVLLVVVLAACQSATGAPAARHTNPASAAAGLVGSAPGQLDAAAIASTATWAPGQLEAHFQKHGEQMASTSDYDASARATIREGRAFTYVDRESRTQRLGFYDRGTNRFTSVTNDGRRITTHFRPDTGERYVRRLDRSSYQ